jgi:hypothetical protein
MRLRLLVLIVAIVAMSAPAPAAAMPSPRQSAPAVAAVATAPIPDERSAPVTVLLVGLGAVVGVVVGLLPALVLAMLFGYLPPPALARRQRDALVVETRADPGPVAPGPATAQARVARDAPREVSPPPAEAPAPAPIEVLAPARHQSVYDAAYAEQSERVEALRTAIGRRLRRPSAPSGE